jgi:hypothetical protein
VWTPPAACSTSSATNGRDFAVDPSIPAHHDDDENFIFSPFGLCCRRIECQPRS